MSEYFQAYLRNASFVLESFEFNEPFAIFLKGFFRRNKKFGSRDRKIITDLCYGYWRLGNSAKEMPVSNGIIAGYYITHQEDMGFLAANFPALISTIHISKTEKLKEIRLHFPGFDSENIFSFSAELSPEIDSHNWALKHLEKPFVFIRIRPGMSERVISKLNSAGIDFDQIGATTIRLQTGVVLDSVLSLEKECVVQDIASQQTVQLLSNITGKVESFWDACSASGGKSIMIHDLYTQAKIYASDLREDILEELRRRFESAQIKAEKIFCNDLSHPMAVQVFKSNLPSRGVDLIIADVPCSGSGTWGRSPEWLSAFQVESIDLYVALQQKIIDQLSSQVQKDKYLLYITCSVFRKENEGMVNYIQQAGKLKLIAQEHLFGETHGGDHMFAALFTSAT